MKVTSYYQYESSLNPFFRIYPPAVSQLYNALIGFNLLLYVTRPYKVERGTF